MTYKPWHVIQVGVCHATYHPTWDPVRPWILYVRGNTMIHAATADEAEAILRTAYGCEGIRYDYPGGGQ